ncbi:carboxymuconolactone decarboxylase family protein [Sphingomonas tabacisoli]|uniref:Carboxymuconolactone decarboxylase family protein n=1 Tax=Sphingomonas tabacisoli TaxID=2249466 RepID=A0ABW4I5P3_9SPHN
MTQQQRMPPLGRDGWTHEIRTLFTILEGPAAYEEGSRSNALLTLARHPDLAGSFFKFNGRLLLKGLIPARLREIAILRVAWLTRSRYEWAQHVRIALLPDALSKEQIEAFRRGEAADLSGEGLLTQDHIEAVKQGADDPIWSELERFTVRAVDENLASQRVSDDTWTGLRALLSEQELIELLFVIGVYSMLAFIFNSLGIEPEEAQQSLAADLPAS